MTVSVLLQNDPWKKCNWSKINNLISDDTNFQYISSQMMPKIYQRLNICKHQNNMRGRSRNSVFYLDIFVVQRSLYHVNIA